MDNEVLPPEDPTLEPPEEEMPQGFSYTGKDGAEMLLDEVDQEWVVNRIKTSFDRFDQDKSKKKRRWEKTKKAVKGVVSDITSDRFNGLVPFGKQSLQTLISHFWGRSLQTPEILFNMRGKDEQSNEMAPLQKENLMQLFKKDRLPQKLDDGVYEALMKGVVIAYIGYEQRKQDFGVPVAHKGLFPEEQMQTPDNGSGMADFEETDYDAATLKIIDPYDFVFDTEGFEKWDKCFKAARSWEIYEDIADNPKYSNFEELRALSLEKQLATSNVNPFSRQSKKASLMGVDPTGRIELIEFHGDFRLKDGSYLRNWTITVAARKKVIQFEKNPWYINPFVKWTYEKTEDGWGISPIDYIIPLIDAGSMLLNTGVEAAKLSINPPWLAEEKAFPQKQFFLQEGMVVKYNPSQLNPTVMPQQIKLNTEAPFPYMQLMETQSEATTGATRQLSGNVTSNDNQQTATEFNGLQIVGNLILDRLVDLFNLDFKIPVIEKMAKITAMFNPAPGNVPIENEQGVQEFKQVTAQHYYGNYDYVIDDNKSEQERKNNIEKMLQFATMLAQDPDVSPRMKKIDTAKEIFTDMGYGSPGKLFMSDIEFIQKKITDTAIAQFIAEVVQQFPLGQMAMANGGVIDPNQLAQMALMANAQAQGAVQNATHPQAQSSGAAGPPTQNGAPPNPALSPAMAAGIPMENIQGLPPGAG